MSLHENMFSSFPSRVLRNMLCHSLWKKQNIFLRSVSYYAKTRDGGNLYDVSLCKSFPLLYENCHSKWKLKLLTCVNQISYAFEISKDGAYLQRIPVVLVIVSLVRSVFTYDCRREFILRNFTITIVLRLMKNYSGIRQVFMVATKQRLRRKLRWELTINPNMSITNSYESQLYYATTLVRHFIRIYVNILRIFLIFFLVPRATQVLGK